MIRCNSIRAALLISSLYFVFAPVTAQILCIGANECDPRVDRSCRPLGGCESFCYRTPCMRPIINCYCRNGYARNATGHCIPVNQCPRACGIFECPSNNPRCRCEAYCRPVSICITSSTGCHCERGYARNDLNMCVPLTMCRRLPVTIIGTRPTPAS